MTLEERAAAAARDYIRVLASKAYVPRARMPRPYRVVVGEHTAMSFGSLTEAMPFAATLRRAFAEALVQSQSEMLEQIDRLYEEAAKVSETAEDAEAHRETAKIVRRLFVYDEREKNDDESESNPARGL